MTRIRSLMFFALTLLISGSNLLAQDLPVKPLAQKLWDFFGVLHPATVHFPIGLLTAAALFVVLRRFRPISPDVACGCLLLGTGGALAATAMGWAFSPYQGHGGMDAGMDKEMFWHRWGGVGVCVLAVATSAMAFRSRPGAAEESSGFKGWEYMVLITAALTGWVGHQGGEMNYGHDFYTKPWKDPEPAKILPIEPLPADGKIDFVKHIQPIFEAHCVACHGPDKVKAKFRIDTREHALTSGDSAPDNLIPGMPDKSLLLEFMTLPDDADELMPPKKEGGPLPKEQIELIRKWIEEGAAWPEGLSLKEKKD